MSIFPVGSMVRIAAKHYLKVAGFSGDLTGKVGKVRAYADLAPLLKGSGEVLHIVDLAYKDPNTTQMHWYAEEFFVSNETPNPTDQYGRRIHGDAPLPNQPVHWVEVPGSCLEAA